MPRYRKILNAPLVKSQYLSADAFDICSKLLERDPTKRLGYNGFEEIQNHPWFKEIDWDALYRKEITPPFNPNVKSESSTENIDEEYISVLPIVTPTPNNIVAVNTDVFDNFSYVEDLHR